MLMIQCSPLLSCLCPRWFLFLARSVESPRWFLFLGRFLVWGQFLFLGGGLGGRCLPTVEERLNDVLLSVEHRHCS